jgi:hypothetical protein
MIFFKESFNNIGYGGYMGKFLIKKKYTKITKKGNPNK